MLTSVSALEGATELPTDPATELITEAVTEATEAEAVTEKPTQTITTVTATDTEPQISILDKTKPVTLNIASATAEYKRISGVGYSLYFVSDDIYYTPDISKLDKSKLEKTDMPLTDEQGKSTITLPKQGVYIVSCTTVPSNVADTYKDFVITLPYTSDDGTQWKYELDASPKLTLVTPTEPQTEPQTHPGTTDTTGTGSGMTTTGNGNGIDTNGKKATVQTGNVAACILIPVAVIFISVGIVFLVKTKKCNTKY
ncbi:MAG: hypothetical protein ACI4RP_05330 [Acutalibacteraceae bacterium]